MNNLVFIGCGNMGSAMIKALLENGIYQPEDLKIIEKLTNSYTDTFSSHGIVHLTRLQDVGAPIKNVILAVKPQNAEPLLSELSERKEEIEVVISIMAGITISQIENALSDSQIIRCMPNTPAAIRSGMSVFCGNHKVTENTFQATFRIFESIGKTFRVDDELMIDATTAISGSGPGYVYYFAEALYEGAIELGFSQEQAELLSSQTLIGAAELLVQSDDSPEELRIKVTSPGGTTEAAIGYFNDNGLKDLLINGFKEAFKRSLELAKIES